ncbi:fimbrial protein, partial [Providencia rettgeri]
VGEVDNGTCAVDADSVNQTVQLGQVRANTLTKQGDVGQNVGFNIVLKDCAPGADDNGNTLPTTAAIIFSGVAVDNTTNAKVLALQQSSAGGATNVGIEVLDHSGQPVAFDGSTASTSIKLNEGTNTIPFQARYMATGQATAGTADADATFTVQYE